jgi:hypothetical protein
VLEIRVLRGVFWTERDEVTPGCRKLCDDKFHKSEPTTKYYSGDVIKENEKGGACSTYGGEEK